MEKIRIGLVGAGWMGKAHSSAMLNEQMLFGPELENLKIPSRT